MINISLILATSFFAISMVREILDGEKNII